MKTNCPVCNYSDLTDDIKICPECKSDLEVFDLIGKSRKAFKNRQILLVVFSICLIAGILLGAYLVYRAYNAVDWRDYKISILENQNTQLLAKIDYLKEYQAIEHDADHFAEEKIPVEKKKEKHMDSKEEKAKQTVDDEDETKDYKIYVILPGDCLWNIALKFYNDGMKYLKIAEDNNLSDVNKIIEGEELKIYEN